MYTNTHSKNLVVLGAGESGVGAAMLAKQQGWKVFVSDYGKITDNYKIELQKEAIRFEEAQHTLSEILQADLVVKSPGIPDTAKVVKELLAKNISVISEIEFAYNYVQKAKIIGITGSNGKTTTSNLTYHILKSAGFNVCIAGNVGFSFAREIALGEKDWYVLELSSFQLDGIKAFNPEIAILLNITPDHLDRYDYKLENYAKSKFRIVENQSAQDHFIYNAEDELISNWVNTNSTLNQTQYPIQMEQTSATVAGLTFSEADMSIKGKHNLFNAACAVCAAQLAGVESTSIKASLANFQNDPHRLEFVAQIDGVEYINDSKATNVDAVYFALDAMKKPLVWILGGTDKGNDYTPLFDLAETKAKAIICLGLDNQKIQESFGPFVKIIEEADSAKKAVLLAKKYAESGDVVLLSPACASFDLFKNYKDRGDQFKAAVEEINV